MKKNIIGHMTAPHESAGKRLRRMDLIRKFLCLVLALMIWLIIENVTQVTEVPPTPDIGINAPLS